MKLLGFRIQNYRSIIDSDWTFLSPDNITGLIGQNESGKTSILEALYSFYEGKISEDILRSDLSLPIVSCLFKIFRNQVNTILNEKLLPRGVNKKIQELGKICLTRIWNDDLSSRIILGGDEINELFSEHEKQLKEKDNKVLKKIEKAIQKKNKAIDSSISASQEKEKAAHVLEKAKLAFAVAQKMLKLSTTSELKDKAEKKFTGAKLNLEQAREKLEIKKSIAEDKQREANEVKEKTRCAEISQETWKEFEQSGKELDNSYKELRNSQYLFDNADTEKEKRATQLQLDITNERYVKSLREYERSREEAILKKIVAYKVLSGKNVSIAEKETLREQPHISRYYSQEEAGNDIYDHIPEFVMFEDFSSLLPNRIDLNDVLDENKNIEGYKAARNFLMVSGLDADFFQQSSNRILKQKIELLNREITVSFHDFWQQKIGKENKIHINFELEHYDYSHSEKSGVPYLEFWIRDRYERLYPKQRSRGVRWFLSFYLELKAAAQPNIMKNKILLIDEPGLSLHARAQEDVLKVFDFIKDKMQIIYSTHSPHLIDLDKLYRLRAVQRAVEDDEKSETVIYDAKSLTAASSDTLSPIYTLMGSRLSEQQFIQQENNVILEDITTYYYLKAFLKLIDFNKKVYFLPATDVSNVGNLVNLLLGWGLDYIVITDDDNEGRELYDDLKKNLFANDEIKADKKLILLNSFQGIEDLFSTIDFKKFVLQKRIGIPESISDYIRENNLSRTILGAAFMQYVLDMKLKLEHFDEETRDNFKNLFRRMEERLN